MSVPSLLNLSIDAAAFGILNDSLPPANFKLNTDLSNKVYQKIYENCKDLEISRRSFSSLQITKADLSSRKTVKYKDTQILRKQSVESLILGDFSIPSTGIFERFKDITAIIEGTLLLMLNDESRKNLQILDIGGFKESVLPGWLATIFTILPSLTNLIMFGIPISNWDIQFFSPNLRTLDISETGLTSLNGIGNLKNLEILAIGGLRFESSEDLIEIFKLEELRVLDLSPRRPSTPITNLLNQYLSCNKTLPNLNFLDCSLTQTTDAMVSKLLRTHPSIQKISLCFTDNHNFDLPGVEVLSVHSLKSSVKSLKWYTNLKNLMMVEQILTRIWWVLEEEYDMQSDEDLRECLTVVCATVEGFPNKDNVPNLVVACLNLLCCDNRIELYSIPERQDLISLLFKFLDLYQDWATSEKQAETVKRIWKFFTNTELLISSNLNYKKVLDYCLDSVAWAVPSNLEVYCITTMKHCVVLMSLEQEKEIFEDLEVCQKILDLLTPLYNRKQFKMYNLVMTMVGRIAEIKPDNFKKLGGVEILIRHLRKYGVAKNLEILHNLVLDGMTVKTENVYLLVKFFIAHKKDWENSGVELVPKTLQLVTSILLLAFKTAERNNEYLRFANTYLESMIEKLDPQFLSGYEPLSSSISEELNFKRVHLKRSPVWIVGLIRNLFLQKHREVGTYWSWDFQLDNDRERIQRCFTVDNYQLKMNPETIGTAFPFRRVRRLTDTSEAHLYCKQVQNLSGNVSWMLVFEILPIDI